MRPGELRGDEAGKSTLQAMMGGREWGWETATIRGVSKWAMSYRVRLDFAQLNSDSETRTRPIPNLAKSLSQSSTATSPAAPLALSARLPPLLLHCH